MHKLNRPSAPACLDKYQHGRDHWKNVTPEDRSEIWLKIDEMQKQRCAYCESGIKTSIEDSTSHIEHLRQRRSHPQLTFKWSNLFGSCNRQDSCGNHKDRLKTYNHDYVIKMDEDDPEGFIEFLPDGSIIPRSGLSNEDTQKAKETIRIFNLDGPLRQIRKAHIQGYLHTAEEFLEMAEEFDEAYWVPLLEEELNRIRDLPFATAIKHILLPE